MARAAIGLGIVAVLLSAFVGWYLWAGPEALVPVSSGPTTSLPAAPAPEEPTAELLAKLNRPARLNVEKVPFSKVLAQLATEHDLAIEPDGLELARHFKPDELRGKLVSLDAGPLPLHSLLALLLSQVDDSLVALPRGERVEITIGSGDGEWVKFRNAPNVLMTIPMGPAHLSAAFPERLEGRAYPLPPFLRAKGELDERALASIVASLWLNTTNKASSTESAEVVPGGIYVLAIEEKQAAIADLLARLAELVDQPDAEPVAIFPWNDEPREAILRAMGQPIGSLHATNLGELIEELRRVHKLPIAADRRALARLGVDLQTPVALPPPEIRLCNLFDFATFAGKSPCHLRLRYWRETLWLTDDASNTRGEEHVVRLYPLGDASRAGMSRLADHDYVNLRFPELVPCGPVLIACGPWHEHARLEEHWRELRRSVRSRWAVEVEPETVPPWRAAALALRKPVSIQFRDLPLREAIRRVAEAAEVSIWFDAFAVSQAGVNPEGLVSCEARDLPLGRVAASLAVASELHVGIINGRLVYPLESSPDVLQSYSVRRLVDPDVGLVSESELTSTIATLGRGFAPFVTSVVPVVGDYHTAWWYDAAPARTLFVFQRPESQIAVEDLLRVLAARLDRPESLDPTQLIPQARDALDDLPDDWRQPVDAHFESVPLRECLADLAQKTGLRIELDKHADDFLRENGEVAVSFASHRVSLLELLRVVCREISLRPERSGDQVVLRCNHPSYVLDHFIDDVTTMTIFYPIARDGESPRRAARLLDGFARSAGLFSLPLADGVVVVGDRAAQDCFVALRDDYYRAAHGEATAAIRRLWPPADPRSAAVEALLDQTAEYLPSEQGLLAALLALAKTHDLPLFVEPSAQGPHADESQPALVGTLEKMRLRDVLAHLLTPRGLFYQVRGGVLHVAANDENSEMLVQAYSDGAYREFTEFAARESQRDRFLRAMTTAMSPFSMADRNDETPEVLLAIPSSLEYVTVGPYGDELLICGSEDSHAELQRILREFTAKDNAPSRAASAAEMRIVAALTQPVTLDKGKIPLAKFVELVATQAAISVVWHEPGSPTLPDGSPGPQSLTIDPEEFTVTCRAKAIPLEVALREILSPRGLTAIVWRDALLITPAPAEGRFLSVHAYRLPERWFPLPPTRPRGPVPVPEFEKLLASWAQVAASFQSNTPTCHPLGRAAIIEASVDSHLRVAAVHQRLLEAEGDSPWALIGPSLDAQGKDAAAITSAAWDSLFALIEATTDETERAFLVRRLGDRRDWGDPARWSRLVAMLAKTDPRREARLHDALVHVLQHCPEQKPELVARLLDHLGRIVEPDRRAELILALGRFAPDSTAGLVALLRPEALETDDTRDEENAQQEFRTLLAAIARGKEQSQAAIPRLVEFWMARRDFSKLPEDHHLIFALTTIDPQRKRLQAAFAAALASDDRTIASRAGEFRQYLPVDKEKNEWMDFVDPPDDWADPEVPHSSPPSPPAPFVPAGGNPFAPADPFAP